MNVKKLFFYMDIIEVIYEDGVFKPLSKVKIKEKTKFKIAIRDRKEAIGTYKGIYGKVKVEELKKLEEEAQIQ